jgi:hypothetical protein
MIIGIDFDNTIVAYDALFHRVALELGVIPADLPVNKTAVRDHLRATDREPIWTEMQGTVYGSRITEAQLFPGLLEFLLVCKECDIPVRIISHKTKFPFLGERYDLHAAARHWLHEQGIIDPAVTGVDDADVFFELTKAEKLARISACGCTHFIDDLPELLEDASFPATAIPFLFDPQNSHPTSLARQKVSSWASLQNLLLGRTLPLAAIKSVITHCCLQLADDSLESLHGGANNRVYRARTSDGKKLLVKQYFQHPNDTRDRFQAERVFYRYLKASGLPQTPVALGWNETERIGIFSFIEGVRPTSVSPEHVSAALDFIADLNTQRARPEALELPVASEANFSIDAHLASVQRRVDRASTLSIEDRLDEEASLFIHRELVPAWTAIRTNISSDYTADERSALLGQNDRCVSPSDFGFHNSLVDANGQNVFFDFEYAGWDDPAKLVADFFCQPDIPVSLRYFDWFVTGVSARLQLSDPVGFAKRCRELLPVYQVKWACILLNDFSSVGRERRIFSLGAVEAAFRRERQLARARTLLSHLLQFA